VLCSARRACGPPAADDPGAPCGAVLTGRFSAGAYFAARFLLRTINKGAER